MIDNVELVARLGVSCLLGGLIGLEREGLNRPAGFRTHVLVALGSTLIMLISIYGFRNLPGPHDPARLAAQVVSGIGFLGAGTIMKEGLSIKGLTTAASLWVVAAIGLASGAGFYVGAVATTILVYVTLVFFTRLERSYLHRDHYVRLTLVMLDTAGQLGKIGTVLGRREISMRNICTSHVDAEEDQVHVQLEVKLPHGVTLLHVLSDLGEVPGVIRVSEA